MSGQRAIGRRMTGAGFDDGCEASDWGGHGSSPTDADASWTSAGATSSFVPVPAPPMNQASPVDSGLDYWAKGRGKHPLGCSQCGSRWRNDAHCPMVKGKGKDDRNKGHGKTHGKYGKKGKGKGKRLIKSMSKKGKGKGRPSSKGRTKGRSSGEWFATSRSDLADQALAFGAGSSQPADLARSLPTALADETMAI